MKKGRKPNRLPPFVAMTWEVLNSPAAIDMCHYSRAALPYVLGKVKLPYGDPDRYRKEFSFPYSEAKRLGFPTSTFAKVICELVQHGFIDPQQKGGCYGDLKRSNKFTLSRRWLKYGKPDFVSSDWKSFIQKPRKNSPPPRRGEIHHTIGGNKRRYLLILFPPVV